jgi:hypothetical protein
MAIRTVGIGVWIVLTSGTLLSQRASATDNQLSAFPEPPSPPSMSVLVRTYASGAILPWRREVIRHESGAGEIVVETAQSPDADGRMASFQEAITETVREGPNDLRTRRDVFRFDRQDRKRRLWEKSEARQTVVSDSVTRTVQDTWSSDVNGHLNLAYRQVQETRSLRPNAYRRDTTVLTPGIGGALEESERTEYSEREITPTVVQYESVHLTRDVNGRWRATEIRSGQLRDTGTLELGEETLQRSGGLVGKLVDTEKTVTRRLQSNGREQVIIETHERDHDGVVRASSPRTLRQRIRRTTTPTADGGRETVEDIEGRNPVALSDPLRLRRRTVESVRRLAPDRWAIERQVYELDINGRMSPVSSDIEETVSE